MYPACTNASGQVYTLNGRAVSSVHLPPFTVRFQFSTENYTPINSYDVWKSDATWTQVSSSPNVWDYHRADPDWSSEFWGNHWWQVNTSPHISILGMNTTGVTNMYRMLGNIAFFTAIPIFDISGTTSLDQLFRSSFFMGSVDHLPLLNTSHITSMAGMFASASFGLAADHPNGYTLPAWDTSNVTTMGGMFQQASNLGNYAYPRIPTGWDTSRVTNMAYMFSDSACYGLSNLNTHNVTDFSYMFRRSADLDVAAATLPHVDTTNAVKVGYMYYNTGYMRYGIYEMYQQLSSNQNIQYYYNCFNGCGSNTPEGQAALAQIPQDWGGTMA